MNSNDEPRAGDPEFRILRDVLKARKRRTVQTAFLTRIFRSFLTGNS
jgi:hypothetical protein